MNFYAVVETSNFDEEHPNETFVGPVRISEAAAERIADTINSVVNNNHDRFWMVVKLPYTLRK